MKQSTLFEKGKVLIESAKKTASHVNRGRLEDRFASRLREELRLARDVGANCSSP